MARRKNSGNTTVRVWAIRAGVAVVLGIGIGYATGVTAVRVLQPPGSADADTAATDTTPRKGRKAPIAANANNENVAGPAPDSAPPRANGILVPKLVGLEEGDARLAITKAGFSVGSVLFRSSNVPAGTVLSSFPVPGEAVQLPATVNLILSDGKGRADSTVNQPQTDAAAPAPASHSVP